MTTNIIFSGVGGQGIVVASDIFCEAALIDGLDVAKAEVHGMAQRGGSIVAHVKVGEKIHAPLIEKGKANIIVGFEMLETARVLPMLNADGTVIVNTKYIPCTSFGCSTKSLDHEKLLGMIKDRAKSLHQVNGNDIANKIGNQIVVNTVLLGALSALPENPVKKKSLEKAIAGRLKQEYVNINLEAFQLGIDQVTMR
jgi:indolepyruvate ferredoxin oxidoreductase beta subunit